MTPLGAHLVDALQAVAEMAAGAGFLIGRRTCWATALSYSSPLCSPDSRPGPRRRSPRLLHAPVLDDAGAYTGQVLSNRLIRVWYDLDMRHLMADLYAKLG